jgi:hypothetical protein
MACISRCSLSYITSSGISAMTNAAVIAEASANV